MEARQIAKKSPKTIKDTLGWCVRYSAFALVTLFLDQNVNDDKKKSIYERIVRAHTKEIHLAHLKHVVRVILHNIIVIFEFNSLFAIDFICLHCVLLVFFSQFSRLSFADSFNVSNFRFI